MAENGLQHVRAPDGRAIEILPMPPEEGWTLLYQGGTPAAPVSFRLLEAAAAARRMRLVQYARPGYGTSERRVGRRVADAAGDVLAILDALGVDRCLTLGWSGGGPTSTCPRSRCSPKPPKDFGRFSRQRSPPPRHRTPRPVGSGATLKVAMSTSRLSWTEQLSSMVGRISTARLPGSRALRWQRFERFVSGLKWSETAATFFISPSRLRSRIPMRRQPLCFLERCRTSVS